MLSARKNFIVSGGTSSGKTTFLNMLLALLVEVDPDRRLLTFEDTRELVATLANYVSFLTKDVANVSARKLVRLGMRFKPDCIWFGEARGEEAYDLLKAYGTGHPGSGFSLHADNPRAALTRLERLIRESDEGRSLSAGDLRTDIANTFSFVIHCERVGKVRALMEIIEVHGAPDGQYSTTTLFKKELDYV
jgi:pilus assembly protein CpaF